jgi:hypothetical protein
MTTRSPAARLVTLLPVKENVIPSSNCTPVRSMGWAPTLRSSTNSKSSSANGLPAGGSAGWYISSVTRSGGGVSRRNVASVSALHSPFCEL